MGLRSSDHYILSFIHVFIHSVSSFLEFRLYISITHTPSSFSFHFPSNMLFVVVHPVIYLILKPSSTLTFIN